MDIQTITASLVVLATIAAMLPSSSTSHNPYDPYDADAVERDLIDPDDGKELPGESFISHVTNYIGSHTG